MINEEKQKALEAALGHIEKQYGKGSVMKLGSGEAILRTPFRSRAEKAIGRLAAAVAQGKETEIATAMPLPRFLFIRAGNRYWKDYGKENGVSYEEMCRMDIENP